VRHWQLRCTAAELVPIQHTGDSDGCPLDFMAHLAALVPKPGFI
jgi:hypothetical protein